MLSSLRGKLSNCEKKHIEFQIQMNLSKNFAALFLLLTLGASILSNAESPRVSPDSTTSTDFLQISADRVLTNNPFNGRKNYCAAFARYGLLLLTGKHYITFGSAWHWARHASAKEAVIPLELVKPGNLVFFRNTKGRINHVAIVLSTAHRDSGNYTITFQDEHGTNVWMHPASKTYLGMRAVFGADPARLATHTS